MDTKSEGEERGDGSNNVGNLFHRRTGQRRAGLRLAIDSARTTGTRATSFHARRSPNHEASRRTRSPAVQRRKRRKLSDAGGGEGQRLQPLVEEANLHRKRESVRISKKEERLLVGGKRRSQLPAGESR